MKMTQEVSLSQEDLGLFESLLLEVYGIRLDRERNPFFLPAFFIRLKERGFQSPQEYYHFIKYHPEGGSELRELIDLITVKETHFFRNKAQFNLLMESVLPEMIRRKERSREKEIRCWSAGCATGDEAYSLAIVLRESLPSPSQWRLSILGTDINRKGLAVARRGVYEEKHLAFLPPAYLKKYFKSEESGFSLNPEIKEMVQFEAHNLSKDPFTDERMQNLDLLFCRNVLIYLDERSARRILEGFYHCLVPEGYLFLGHAEILWQMDHQFETLVFPQTFIYRKRVPSKAPEDLSPKTGEASEGKALCPPPGIRSTLSIASQLANEGHYQEAADLLKRIVEEDPTAAEAHHLLGILFLSSNRLDEAEGQFQKVVYLSPHAPIAYFHLGMLYLRKGRRREASRMLRNALRLLEKRPKEEKVEFCEEVTVGSLLKTCKEALTQIPKGGSLE
jgi:chemotaxis protein methyltransferase CheR